MGFAPRLVVRTGYRESCGFGPKDRRGSALTSKNCAKKKEHLIFRHVFFLKNMFFLVFELASVCLGGAGLRCPVTGLGWVVWAALYLGWAGPGCPVPAFF